MQMDTTDGRIYFRYDVDQSFIVDDKILVRQIPDTVMGLDNIDPDNQVINTMLQHGFSLSFCEDRAPGFHYEHLFHDPTMTILYSPLVDSPIATPTAKAQAKRAWIAVVVVVGIVVLAVIGFIVLLQVKPELKSVFRPFRSRKVNSL